MSKLIGGAARLYPFYSGAGWIANSAVFRAIDPPGGEDRIAHVKGGRAMVPAGDHVGRAMQFIGDLDPKVSWVVDRALGPGDIALDIGANLGLVSLRMSARVGTTGQVHAFEPQPRLLRYLEQTKALNPECPLTVHPIALGAEDATMAMHVPAANAGAASLRGSFADRDDIQAIEVPVRRLDDYAKEIGLDRTAFIKMDVEGFEADVLEGATQFLEHTRPHVIVLEENRPAIEDGYSKALRALIELDYKLHSLPRQYLSVKLFRLEAKRLGHDFVAVSSDAPERIWRALRLQP